MDMKKAAMQQLMKLMQNERVMKLAMNPRVMGAVMKAMSLRSKISGAADAATDAIAHSLNLATEREVNDLKATIRRLEEILSQMEARDEDSVDRREE